MLRTCGLCKVSIFFSFFLGGGGTNFGRVRAFRGCNGGVFAAVVGA